MARISSRIVVEKTSLVDQALDFIHIAIFDGELSPGMRVSLTDLSKRIGISRTPLREAIRKAESEGLIKSLAGKGFVVRTISKKEVEEIYMLRILLEPLAASMGCNSISDADIKKVEKAQQKIRRIALKYKDKKVEKISQAHKRAFHDANLKFHFTIYNASQNATLTELIDLLWSRSVLIVGSTLSTVSRIKEVVKEHDAIFDALRNRDCDRIKIAAEHHLLMTKAEALEHNDS